MKNVLVAGLVASIVLFVWGALFWSVLPTNNMGFASLDPQASADLGAAIKEAVPTSGTYLFPDAYLPFEEYKSRHEEGPVAMLLVKPQGMQAMPPSTLAKGFAHLLAACLLAATLLKMASRAFSGFRQRFVFVFLCFLFATVLTDLNGPVWWQNPAAFHAMTAVFHLTGGLLAAAVLAYFVSDNA